MMFYFSGLFIIFMSANAAALNQKLGEVRNKTRWKEMKSKEKKTKQKKRKEKKRKEEKRKEKKRKEKKTVHCFSFFKVHSPNL
jgi:hypothetical protein